MAVDLSNKALQELAQECEWRAHAAHANKQHRRVEVFADLALAARGLVAFREQEAQERTAKKTKVATPAV